MKKLIIVCTLLAAVSVHAEPTFPKATFPGHNGAAVETLDKKVAAKAAAAKNLAARKVPVTISALGMEDFKASGVLLDVNTQKTQAKILLDENASRQLDIIGEGDYDSVTEVTIKVDLSAFGKGFYSKNSKAAHALRSDGNRGPNEPVLYVYTMPVNPKGKFADAVGVMRAISIPSARKMLKK